MILSVCIRMSDQWIKWILMLGFVNLSVPYSVNLEDLLNTMDLLTSVYFSVCCFFKIFLTSGRNTTQCAVFECCDLVMPPVAPFCLIVLIVLMYNSELYLHF